MIALDTTTIIDLFKGHTRLREIIANIKDPLVSTQLNYLELMFGIDPLNAKHREEEEYYNEFFGEVMLLGLDNHSSKRASEIHWILERKGRTIGKFDCVIAGILLRNGVDKILTKNVKHFEHVPGLRVVTY